MNIIYVLQDKELPGGSSTAVAEVTSMFYDSHINGAVVMCADGATLVKRASLKYFASNLKDFIATSAKSGIVFVGINNMGAFMRVPPGKDYNAFVRSNRDAYRDTIAAWDVEAAEAEKKSAVSRMNLH